MTKDKTFNWKFCFCCGIFIWFVVNLLQGIFTEIQEDEAYYALYGEHLAWGYFDHPPMVGLMTFLSSIFFSGTLGVRFFTIIVSCLSLFVMWKIANLDCFVVLPRNDAKRQLDNSKRSTPNATLLFFTLAFSIAMFNVYGFVTTPDASLIFFSALFLLVYQRYLEHNTWSNALLMGLFMALMIYSKYHAFLLLGLILLSNLRLLKDGKFYVACLLTLALLIPHILWQVHADFPSLRYHLSQRSEPFRWSYFFEYLPNQLLIFNPFTFGAMVYVLFKRGDVTANDTRQFSDMIFERGLKFILIGFFLFFWLMTFRGHVEPHWTIVCIIPIVVLLYRKALSDDKLRRYIMHFILPSLLLIVASRALLHTPLASRFGFSDKKAYYQAIETLSGGRPVVFRGSFQQPALYHYFTGKESSTLKGYYNRMTQFDLWQFDKAWIGKEVFICGPVDNLSEHHEVNGIDVEGFLSEDFSSANRLITTLSIINADEDKTPVFHHGDTLQVSFSIHNPCDATIDFHHKDFNMIVKAHYLPGDSFSYCFYDDIKEISPHATYHGQLHTRIGDDIPAGKYHFNLGISDRVSSYVTESSGVEIKIEP